MKIYGKVQKKMKFDTDYIEKLAKIINDNSLTEISLEDGEQAITVRKDLPEIVQTGTQVVSSVPQFPQNVTKEEIQAPIVKGIPITSPMVGTFYTSPSPDAEPFVKIGQTIKEGDIVCIVEAMKLMNEIESDVSGKIIEICVKDGQPVEFGQVLMYVE